MAASLDAARAVMRENGVAALSLSEVARRLGMRGQSLYEYFPSKSALYDALFRLGWQLYWERLESVLWQDFPSVWDLLTAWMECRLAFARANPDLDHLILSREVPGFVPSEASLAASGQMLGRALDRWDQIVASGVIEPGVPPADALNLFLAMMHGLTTLQMANEPEAPITAGRFSRLIPQAVVLFRAAWAPIDRTTSKSKREDT
jgi:AcrR family transcriptional regulator